MIPELFIEDWKQHSLWRGSEIVEQDLIINKALVCLYNNKKIKDNLIFRGGTALNKIYLKPPIRYSEDLDFVQRNQEPPGEIMKSIRNALDWLGKPKFDQSEHSVKMIYKYISANNLKMRLKIEINVSENFQVMDICEVPFNFNSEWFSGSCFISVNHLEELMATKIRALYQRRKGRDLFDIWFVFSNNLVEQDKTIEIFKKYCAKDNIIISEKLFRQNLELKRLNQDFRSDMEALLPNQANWNFDEAFEYVNSNIITKL